MNASSEPRRDLSYVLGRIEASLETIAKTLAEDRLASASYRTEVRKELKDHTERMQTIEAKLSTAVKDIADMKPDVAELKAGHHQRTGAANVVSGLGRAMSAFLNILAGLLGATVALFVDKLLFHK